MKQKTIMIVDDSSFDRQLLESALLRKLGCNIIQADSGNHCLEQIGMQKVDLILMDIMMPEPSGTQVVLEIRKNFNAIELPIIMVTAKAETLDVVECLQNGANDYIMKPMNFEVALSRIFTHLKLAEVAQEMSKLKEMAALDALITTYNHEINNPLSIALGSLGPEPNQRLKTALWRIADVVKKIREVTEKKEAEYANYASFSKMIKLKLDK